MRILLVVLILSVLLVASSLTAQSAGPHFVGVAAGPEAIPSAYTEQCGRLRGNDPAAATGGAVLVGARLRPALAAVARLSYSRLYEETCLAIPETRFSGIHTDHYRGTGYHPRLFASDLRLRYQPNVPWVLSAGGGWMWSHSNPFLVGGIGWSFGSRVRATLGAEVAGHRIEVGALTREWKNSQVIRVISEEREHLWRMGFAFRVGIELHLR